MNIFPYVIRSMSLLVKLLIVFDHSLLILNFLRGNDDSSLPS